VAVVVDAWAVMRRVYRRFSPLPLTGEVRAGR